MLKNSLVNKRSIRNFKISEPVSSGNSVFDSYKNNQYNNIGSSPTSPAAPQFPEKDQQVTTEVKRAMSNIISAHTTIVIAKFDFKAENSNELSVSVGEALKLIERKGNGWIIVKPIGRVSKPGLIPNSYVRTIKLATLPQGAQSKEDTEVDHQQNDIELESNQEKITSETAHLSNNRMYKTSDEEDYSLKSNSIPSSSSTELEVPFPYSGLIKNASCNDGRYWYRIDISMTDGSKRYICRYYQDFYKLHCSIMSHVKSYPDFEDNRVSYLSKLPTLPDPIPRPDLQTLSTILLQRVQALNVYIFKIVQNKHNLNYKDILNEWSTPRIGDLETQPNESFSNEQVEKLLCPMPTKVVNQSQQKDSQFSSSVTPPLPYPSQNFTPLQPPRRRASTKTTVSPISTSLISTNSNSPTTSPSSPTIWPSPTVQSTPSWSIRSQRSGSAPTIRADTQFSNHSWMDEPTRPLKTGSNSNNSSYSSAHSSMSSTFSTTANTSLDTSVHSTPTKRNLSLPLETTNKDFLFSKVKVFSEGDIFALRIRSDATLKELKDSIATRLECDLEKASMKLYYKELTKNYFIPMSDEDDWKKAFGLPKISVKVQII